MAYDLVTGLIPGIVLGIIFGFVLQRGRFCMNSAFRDPLLLKDFSLLKAVILAIAIEMLGFALMQVSGIITMAPKSFSWAAQLIGGSLFGMGMVLAAGCASGTTYRVGEGMIGSLMALLAFALGGYMAKKGVLKQALADLKTATGSEQLVIGGLENSWIYMLIIGSIILISGIVFGLVPKLKGKKERNEKLIETESISDAIFKKGWAWWAPGIAIGIIGIIAYVSSAASGRNYPLGITGGWIGFMDYLVTGNVDSLSWEVFLVLGVVIGAFVAAIIAGEFKLRAPKAKNLLIQFIGGIMMGIGAVFASGCNIGNTLSGVPQLSVGSIYSTVFIILGCWVMVYFLFMRDRD